MSTETTCASIEEVRANIDRIDHSIVALLAERSAFVKQVVRFKTTTEDVKAPERAEQVIARAKALAEELGADPSVTEQVFSAMVAAFIDAELNELAARQSHVPLKS
jgi:isochorismate pyruvate lyase